LTARLCPYCGFPGTPIAVEHGAFNGAGLVLGICARCDTAQSRLPAGTARKRKTAAARRATADPARYWCAVFPDPGAAQLAAGLIGHPRLGSSAQRAVGWIAPP
jgi:hypothetical protein